MNILNFLFPNRCVSCGRLGGYICSSCFSKIEIIKNQICPVCERPAVFGATHPRCQTKYSLDGLTSFFIYDGPIKAAIKDLKYKFVTDLLDQFVSLIDSTLIFQNIKVDKDYVLVSVPLHWQRFNWRGFNQAELLGRLIAKKLRIKFIPDLLKRKKQTYPQVKLTITERKKNIKDAFIVSQKNLLCQFSKIILFDDIWTTGATLRTCTKVLKANGAKKVWGLTLAR